MRSKSRILALLTAVIIIACTVSVFSSCGDTEKNDQAKSLTEQFVNSVVADDADAAFSLMTPGVDKTEFDSFFVIIRGYFEGAKDYELNQTGWNVNINNGVSSYRVTFTVNTDNGAEIEVETTIVEGYENIYHIHFTPIKSSDSALPILFPFQMGALALSLAEIAFCIWMIVDCAKRNIKKKALWIILILVGVSVGLSVGQGIHFDWLIGLVIGGSSVTTSGGLVSFEVMIPVGAIIYFILRKKMTTPTSVSDAQNNAAIDATSVDSTNEETTETKDSLGED